MYSDIKFYVQKSKNCNKAKLNGQSLHADPIMEPWENFTGTKNTCNSYIYLELFVMKMKLLVTWNLKKYFLQYMFIYQKTWLEYSSYLKLWFKRSRALLLI